MRDAAEKKRAREKKKREGGETRLDRWCAVCVCIRNRDWPMGCIGMAILAWGALDWAL